MGTYVLPHTMSHLNVKLLPDTCFGIVSGSHTYFLAAESPKEVGKCGILWERGG